MKKILTVGLAALTLASSAAPVFAAPPLGDKDHDGIPNAIDNHDDRWDPAWGHEVHAPRGWDHKKMWNHHVGMCRDKYPTFDAHRNMYKAGRHWRRCTL